MRVRAVHLAELPVLQDIERAAGRSFRDVGMSEVADDDPLSLAELARYHHAGLAWVAVDSTDTPWNAPYYLRCGFAFMDDRDITPGLREIREREAAHGLDRWPRTCMRRAL